MLFMLGSPFPLAGAYFQSVELEMQTGSSVRL
jgi:hypothetical protein